MNYTYLYKHHYSDTEELSNLDEYDVFITMFVDSSRVKEPASKINSHFTLWLTTEIDKDNVFLLGKNVFVLQGNEDFVNLFSKLNSLQLKGKNVCIDSTGFRIQYLLFLMRCLLINNVKRYDVIYTEPVLYRCAENTEFSANFYQVKELMGMSGVSSSITSNDLLIIAAGYDHSRIIDVAKHIKNSKKVLLFGFPSLSPDMFQENILRAHEAETDLGAACFANIDSNIFAPAYDPFVAAETIKEYIEKEENKVGKPFTHIYLAPLSSKPHAIAMGLYFLCELGWTKPMSVIYPFCNTYFPDNSDGISKIWRYMVEVP